MAIAFVTSSQNNTDSGSGGSTVVNAPTSIVSGNMLVALCFNSTNTNTAWTPPSGWTSQGSSYDGSGNDIGQLEVFTKVATGSEPGTYSFTGGPYRLVQILQYSGVDTTTPLDGSIGFQAYTSAASSFVAPSVSASASGLLICQFDCWQQLSFTAGPSGMTARINQHLVSHAAQYTYELAVSAGATGTKSATPAASDTGRAISFILKTASAPQSNGSFFF